MISNNTSLTIIKTEIIILSYNIVHVIQLYLLVEKTTKIKQNNITKYLLINYYGIVNTDLLYFYI